MSPARTMVGRLSLHLRYRINTAEGDGVYKVELTQSLFSAQTDSPLPLAHTRGGLSFDSSIPITDAHLKTLGPIFAGARTINLFGKSGKIDVIVPFARLRGSALYLGRRTPFTALGRAFGRPSMRPISQARERPFPGSRSAISSAAGGWERRWQHRSPDSIR